MNSWLCFGLCAVASVPLTFLSVRWWQGLHPVVFERQGANLTRPMLLTFLFCLLTFTLLYLTLLLHRVRLARLESQVQALTRRLDFERRD